jgi:hypothetical protein
VNGQAFEHLHAKRAEASVHSYTPSECGFEAQNVGRGSVLAVGTVVQHFVWFEEWATWSGVELHGKTQHGALFHASMDRFIEEEWTFYQVPKERAGIARIPTAAGFFNHPSARCANELHIAHLKTASDAQRGELLLHFRPGSAGDQLISELVSEEDESGYTLLLENRFKPGEFVYIVEGRVPGLGQRMKEILASAPCEDCGAVLLFGPPLWPEDLGLTAGDIGGSDELTLPKVSSK